MKKYIAPSIEYFNIINEDILTGSIGSVQGEYDGDTPLKARESSTDLENEEYEW